MATPHPDLTALVATAHRVADAARVETLRLFRRIGSVEDKSANGARFDPVTEADRAAETAMRAVIARERPDDGILGEEFDAVAGTSGLTWVLDPIDGTRSYMSGAPTWGVLVAVCTADGPIYGIIDQPFIGERFEGGLGHARVVGPLGDMPLRVRGPRPLADCVLFSTFPEVGTPEERAAFDRVAGQVKLVRYGTDCYAYGLLAAGQIDLVIEAGLQAYDVCAPIAVIEAAGGLCTDWTGQPGHRGGRILAAAGSNLHREVAMLLQSTQ